MRLALRLAAVAVIGIVYVVVSLFALSAWETSTARSGWFFAFADAHSRALEDARSQALREGQDPSSIQRVCDYPPEVSSPLPPGVLIRLSDEELLGTARCLNRRGYLSTAALRKIEQGEDGAAGVVRRHRASVTIAWLAGLLLALALAARFLLRRRPHRGREAPA